MNRRLQIFIYSLFMLNSVSGTGQEITAYTDNRDNLQVFDRELFRQIEYLPVNSYKIGGNAIAYIDNKNDFKIYYDGQSINLLNAADFSYQVTNNLIAFRVGAVQYVF